MRSNSFIQNGQLDTSLDLRVFAFAAIIAVVSTVLIGAGSCAASHVGQPERPHQGWPACAAAGRAAKVLPRCCWHRRSRWRLMLVVGAGLLATSLVRLFESGVGFDPKGLDQYRVQYGQAATRQAMR